MKQTRYFGVFLPLAFMLGCNMSPSPRAGSATSAPAAKNYELKALETDSRFNGEAMDINNSNLIVGGYTGLNGNSVSAIIWKDEKAIPIDLGTEFKGMAKAVNSSGIVVGNLFTDDRKEYGFKLKAFSKEPLIRLDEGTQICAINSQGLFVGYRKSKGIPFKGFYGKSSELIEVPGLLNGSQAKGVNDLGSIVGVSYYMQERYAFVATNSNAVRLSVPGGAQCSAEAINNNGAVVGTCQVTSGAMHAFLWHNGKMTDLGTLGGLHSFATDINNNNVVVGTSFLANNKDRHAFVWKNGKMYDLGTLGGRNSSAKAINDNGVIVGSSQTTKSLHSVAMVAYPKSAQ